MDRSMRLALLALAGVAVATVLVLGVRGTPSRDPPRRFWPDMAEQPKFLPQSANPYFADGRAQRLPVEGTVPWGRDTRTPDPEYVITPESQFGFETIPVPIDRALLERGRSIFEVYCFVCHGRAGDGKGITTKYGMNEPPSYHSDRVLKLKAGDIFRTITEGKGQMGSYADKVALRDRWAVVAWVRTLQRTFMGTIDDVPEDRRGELER